ncbi:MAG TPA: serine/threonine-protein kinase, partial [Burkholderiales bacterium]|nr:serine/threonine-protein kinase [Burkholderiales bacterium]
EDQSVQPKTASVQESFDWGLKRFLEESRTLASFRHPNIVRVMRFFEANRTAYMVMEFIAGKPLNEWVKTCTTLDEAGLTRIAAPLLDGLEVIHRAGYLHRDIKPPNIFMRDDNSPILIDFGSARMKVSADQNLTAIVSPGFSPLEQYHVRGKQGAWTDLYSLAGVLYWLSTGKKPFEAAAREREDTMPTAVAIGRRGNYSEKFLAAIDWALKPCEQDRPQSVAEFRAALIAGAPAVRDAAPLPVPVPENIVSPASVSIQAAFEPTTLKRVEAELAAYLGPIAGVIVKNAAKKVATVPALAHLLAPEISDIKARAAFVRKFSSDNSMPPSQPGQGARMTSSSALASEKSSATALQRFNDETLRRAETALAQYIGAVAKVVVKHAAQKARDENELYLLLGDEIADKAERKSFVRKGILIPGKN